MNFFLYQICKIQDGGSNVVVQHLKKCLDLYKTWFLKVFEFAESEFEFRFGFSKLRTLQKSNPSAMEYKFSSKYFNTPFQSSSHFSVWN